MARKFLISRVALAVALSSGLAISAMPGVAAAKAKKDEAPKPEFSPEFVKAAGPLEKAMGEALKKIPAQGAGAADMTAAKDAFDASVGGDGKAAFAAAEAVATTPDDKRTLGSWMRNYAIFGQDTPLRQKANVLMIDSGKLSAQEAGRINFDAGINAYNAKDYQGAIRFMTGAKAAGFADPDGNLDKVLDVSYRQTNNPAAALELARQNLAAAKASGTKPSETAIRTALQASLDGKQLAPSVDYAVMLSEEYPSQQSWNTAIAVVRALAPLQPQEYIDLMRLMDRTNSFTSNVDYGEFIDLGTTQGMNSP